MALIDNWVSNFVAHCEKAGLSYAEVARRAGIHVVTVSRIVHKHMNPTIDVCEKLSAAAGMNVERSFSRPAEKVA